MGAPIATRRVLLGAFTIQGFGRATSLLLQAAAFGILARFFTPATFGDFAVALALIGIVGAIANFGLAEMTVLELERRGNQARAVGRESMVAASLLAGASLILATPLALILFSGPSRDAFFLLIPYFIVTRLITPAIGYHRYQLSFRRLTVAEMGGWISALAWIGFSFAVGRDWSLGAKMTSAAAGQLVGSLTTLACLFPRKRHSPRQRSRRHRLVHEGHLLRSSIRFIWAAAPIGAVGAISLIHVRVDQVILEAFGLERALANYAVAYRLVDASLGLVAGVGAVAFALMSRMNLRDRPRVSREANALLAVVGFTAALAIYWLAPILVLVFAGEAYRAAVWPARLLSPAILVSVMNIGPAYVAILHDRSRDLVRVGAVSVLVNLGLNLILIPRLGVAGSAIATDVSEMLGFLLVMRVASAALPKSQYPLGSLTLLGGFGVVSFGLLSAHSSGNLFLAIALLLLGTISLTVGARELVPFIRDLRSLRA